MNLRKGAQRPPRSRFPDWFRDRRRQEGWAEPKEGAAARTVKRTGGPWALVGTWDKRGPRERMAIRLVWSPIRPFAGIPVGPPPRWYKPKGRTPRRHRSTTAGRDDGDDHPGEPDGPAGSRRTAALELLPPFSLALASVSAALVARLVWA